MSYMKFEIDRFSGRKNFNIWKIQMMALLRREGSIYAIERKYPDRYRIPTRESEYKYRGDCQRFMGKAGKALSGPDHLDVFNKLVMDLQTAGIKKDEETLACALLFSLTSKYCNIENSMKY
ncbi:hypothetical protein KY290_010782 [Solanum tuberosum]|uniref:Uncharacterized protein n=1 Tax=Solanum tuberosum TaxID=4113 RepID=A0ABQ7VZ90_SOLTU|nr:hypothetical protein KY290_010782 [Solanum tuberosum]